MNHHAAPSFWRSYEELPEPVRELADKQFEILKIDPGIDELIARRATAREILTAARAHGFRTLADDGARLVRSGASSLDELMRVVDLTDRMA